FLILSDQDGDWDGPSNNWLTAYIEDNYQNGGIPRLALQDNKAINTSFGLPPVNLVSVTENRSVAGCNGVVEPSVVTTCFNMPPGTTTRSCWRRRWRSSRRPGRAT